MPKQQHLLTESDRGTLTNGLRAAAERFKEFAATIRKERWYQGKESDACIRLAQQFDKQAMDSLQLAGLLEIADGIAVIGALRTEDETERCGATSPTGVAACVRENGHEGVHSNGEAHPWSTPETIHPAAELEEKARLERVFPSQPWVLNPPATKEGQ